MTKRKPKPLAQLVRDLHASEPTLTPTELSARVGGTPENARKALRTDGMGKRGPKLKRPLCPACGGTGRVQG